ncbi:NAD dependent epimerase/dehydratase family protein, partial [Streptomyces sp. DI166]
MRILVLGFTGYLGGHVVERLRALPGARVLGGGRSRDADHHVDLATADPEHLAKTLASAAPDAVVNCAGAVAGDPVTLAEVNTRGPAVLCAALRTAAPAARLGPSGLRRRVRARRARRRGHRVGADRPGR